MYLEHWGLDASPFRNVVDPRCFYPSPGHEEALARLAFLVDSGRRLGVLLGDEGTGKSLVLSVVAEHLQRAGHHVAQLSLLDREGSELLASLAAAWGITVEHSATATEPTTAQLWRAIDDRLLEHRLQRIHDVVLLDDADEAQSDVLRHVTRLVQSDPSGRSQLTVIVAARTARLHQLGERLLQLADLRIDVAPWELNDTERYVQQALQQAGARRHLFTATSLARLHELADGVPRHINQIAELSLLAAAGAGLEHVDPHTIETAYQELGVREPLATFENAARAFSPQRTQRAQRV